MNKLGQILGIGLVIILIVELLGTWVSNGLEEEAKNPFDSEGKIKDGYTVSFEEEAKLSEESYPEVSDEEYQEELMYVVTQCILTAKELDSYECIGNNLTNSFFNAELDNKTDNEKGKYIYQRMLQGRTPTGVNSKLLKSNNGENHYEVTLSTLDSKNKRVFIFLLKDRKIQEIIFEEG